MRVTRNRRILALLLTLAMILTLLPNVFAADPPPFSDVKQTDWFYNAVVYCRDSNLMSGTGNNQFSPNVNLTRSMLVSTLYRLADEPPVTFTDKFPDVPEGEWYSKAVIWAAENEIAAGYSDGRFGTADNVTREQAATFLYRYAKWSEKDVTAAADLSGFPDNGKVSAYALDSMKWAVAKGVMSGKKVNGVTVLDPQGFATRAEIAALLMGFCEKVILPAQKSNDIVVLYTNDVHCNVEAVTDDKTGTVTNMGYTNVAALKKELLTTNHFVTLVDAGDAVQGGPVGTLSKGASIVEIMNQAGYDYATFGNHEYDYGMDQLLNTLVPAAKYQYLSCNFAKTDNKAFENILGYSLMAYKTPDGEVTTVGYIGITTPESFTKSTPTYFQDDEGNYIYTFCEGENGAALYKQVQDIIDKVQGAGADYIVAIAHLGIDEASKPWTSTEVIANTTGLDVVLDGHSHSTIASQSVKDKNGEDVLLSSTGTKLQNIGKLTISADGKLSTELISGYTETDAATDAVVKSILDKHDDLLKTKVASSEVDLTIMSPDGAVRAIRNRETNLGDLCADAYRLTLGADIAFVNGGGIRASIPAGDITYEQIITVHPYGNMACVVEATGQQIIDALEMSSRAVTVEDRVTGTDGKVNASGELGGFLQVSGLKYTVDTSVASTVVMDDKQNFVKVETARRVKNVQVLQPDGSYAPIVLDKTYKLASHNYMLKSGGDGLNMFMGNKVLQDEVMIDNQVLITYIESMGGTVGAEYANLAGQGRISVVEQYEDTGYLITGYTENGNAILSLTSADILAQYAYGDILEISLPTGEKLELPLVRNASDVDTAAAAILAGEDNEFVVLAVNAGSFAESQGLATKTEDDSEQGFHWEWIVAQPSYVKLTLKEWSGYLVEFLHRQLSRSDNRADYASGTTEPYPVLSDAEFANFRKISTTGMGANVLFRSSSPIDSALNRNTYADAAAQSNGIQTVVNLADSQETMEAYPGYALTNYATLNILPLNMGTDYHASEFKTKLANGLRYIAQQSGPYLIHCNDGRDRTGFVAAILEAYMGADYNEIITDYMTTYYNYNGVVFGSEQAIALSQSTIVKALCSAFDIDDITTADLQAEATAYLKEIGLNENELSLLTRHLGGEEGNIVVLFTNDVHCAVEPVSNAMGYANLAALKKDMEKKADFVTLVDAGDALQGGPIGTLSKGEYLVDIMNYVGYDYATFGNHEFDYGTDYLLNTLVPKAEYHYLSCNFFRLNGTTATVPEGVKGTSIHTYGTDTKIAYIGITTPESFTKSTPTYFQDDEGNYIYTFCERNDGAELYSIVQQNIDAAKSAGADYIIAIAHLGTDEASAPWRSTDVIANTSGLDVVLDGHSHSIIGAEYVTDKENNRVLLSSTGTKFFSIGKLTINRDTGAIQSYLLRDYYREDADTKAYIDSIKSQYDALLKEKVASSTVDLTIMSSDGAVRAIRSRETNLGDLCADAYRLTLGADIAFVNGGGIRASIPAGDITYEQIITVHPYGNMACVVEATGQQIIDALEMSSRAVTAEDRVTDEDGSTNASGELGGFLQVSGLKYTVDPFRPSTVKLDDKGSFAGVEGARRVSDVQVLQADGTYAPIVLTDTYKLASHNYMLKSGGDGLNMFKDNKVLQDEVMIDNQVLITYIESMGGTVGAEYANLAGQGRITVIAEDPTPSFKGTETAAIADGDRIAIVLAKDGTTLSTMPYYYAVKGYNQLVGAPATIAGTEAACENPFVTFTVRVDDSGNYHFTEGGQYLTSGATGNNISMEDEDSDLAAWILESDGNGAFYLKNATAAFNENAEYLEYFTNFTTYTKGATADPTLYAFKLYKLEEGRNVCEHTYERTAIAPACTEDGSTSFTCSLCAETKTKTLPKLGHDYAVTENADEYIYTCSRCADSYTVEKGKTATLTATLTAGDEIAIYHPASGTTLDATANGTGLAGIAAAVNDDTLNVVKATTIFTVGGDETGYTFQTKDGKYLTSGATGNALSLTDTANDCSKWTLTAVTGGINLKNAGANYNGNYNQALEYYGDKYTTYGIKSTDAFIFQLYKLPGPCETHTWDAGEITTAATCTTAGEMRYTCTVCEQTKTEEIAALGHDIITDAAVPASCTETGLTAGSHCSRCTAMTVAQQSVPALGHSWDAGVVTVPATCAAQGEKTVTCTVCAATSTAPVTVLAPHQYADGSCTVCGKAQPAPITSLDELVEGGEYIFAVNIGTAEAPQYYALNNVSTTTALIWNAGAGITLDNGKLGSYTSGNVFTLKEGTAAGSFLLESIDENYFCALDSGSQLRLEKKSVIEATLTGDTPLRSDIAFRTSDGGFTILFAKTLTETNQRHLAYDSSKSNFRVQASSSMSNANYRFDYIIFRVD